MRAVIITKPGGPEVLELRDVADPVPAGHEVLVRIHASALNRADLMQRAGHYPAPPGAPKDIPGLELAGEVAGLGPSASRWKAGDRVFGIVGGGAHAELATVHEDTLVAIPGALSYPEAAAIPEAFMTAHDALRQAAFKAGDRVLIPAVASGVGLAAVQLIAALGGRSFGTTRTPAKLDSVRAHGLHHGIVIGSPYAQLAPRVLAWTEGRGADIVLDLVGGDFTSAALAAIARQGRLILIGLVAGRSAQLDLGAILGKRLTIIGTVMRARSLGEKIAVARAFEREVVPLLEQRTVKPVIDSIMDMRDIRAAHERMASNETTGKVVLTMSA